jgi:hypothetical protein
MQGVDGIFRMLYVSFKFDWTILFNLSKSQRQKNRLEMFAELRIRVQTPLYQDKSNNMQSKNHNTDKFYSRFFYELYFLVLKIFWYVILYRNENFENNRLFVFN